ncbi:MAG: hypothetical protein J6K45_01030 [Clostridia bacterium]|nr:hypothetical protein [Clostridia bacterium]
MEENDEKIKRAKEEQSEAEEKAHEEEKDDDANDEDGAASKFSHSLDDDDEDEEEQDDDKEKDKSKKKKESDDDDSKDEDEEKKESDDDNAGKDSDEQDTKDSQRDADDAADDLDDAGKNFDEENANQQELQEGRDNNTSDMSSNPEANTSPKPEETGKTGETDSPSGMGDEPGGPTEPSGAPEDPEIPEGNTAPSGTETGTSAGAETAGAETAGAETAAAEGAEGAAATEGVAATEGAAAAEGVAATEGAAAAEGAAAGGAAAAPVIGIVLLVILIIFVIIGVAGFFTTMPQFLWNRFKEFALDLWDGFQGYFIGMDEAGINQDDIIVAAQYLYDMGYDLVGMGFAESVEIVGQKDANGNEIPEDDEHQKNEIISIDAPYLRAYLVAENRTYLVNNYTFCLKSFMDSFFNGEFFSDDGHSAWGTGLINLSDNSFIDTLMMPIYSVRVADFNIGEAIKGVKIDRSTNQMRIRRINWELAVWKTHFDYTYYSLEGWTGRYGKPFELMITLHVATMAPDLVKEFAINKDLDAKVNIKLTDTRTLSGEICVDGVPLSEMQTGYDSEGNWTGTYSKETMDWLNEVQEDKAEEIKTAMPYISSVTSHWFRNVYFEGKKSKDASGGTVGDIEIGLDNDGDGLEDYTGETDENGGKIQLSGSLAEAGSVYNEGDVEVTLDYADDDIPAELAGKSITITGTIADGMTQTKDAVRGMTNKTTKAIFVGGKGEDGTQYEGKYYIYDGTVERAKAIQAARRGEDNGVTKEKVNLTKESLQAFTILEGSETLDAQFIYRDLKELVIEIGYFEREDFYEIEKQVLEWPVPDYIPAEWPNKEIEKQVLEYGSIIACDETIAYSLGMSLEELQKLTGTFDEEDDEDNEDDTDDELDVLKGMTFIGDDYILGIKNNVNIENAEYYYEGMPGIENQGTNNPGPQYWLDNIAQLPSKLKKVVICTGVGDPREYEEMKGLIDALNKKYDYAIKIYVVEVLHVTANHTDADAINKIIDTYNSHVRNKCKVTPNATFIEASKGLVQNGYMINGKSDGEGSGRVLADSEYDKFAKNIAFGVNDSKYISHNATDEQFVIDLLKSAKQVTSTIKEKEFQYGNADYMPPRTNEKIDEVNGTTDEDGNKKITTDKMISWALYKCGYKDQPESGLSVGEDGDFISYLEEKEWTKITEEDEIIPGDIVFTDQIDEDKANHVYLYAGNGKYYDCDSQEKISQTGSIESQPIEKSISNFMCAYRVTGDGLINSGVKSGLDVIAMGNGRVTQILSEENNLFTENYMAEQLYGEEANQNTTTDEAPGREQSLEGVRIKLTDNALRGYVLVIYGFEVNNGITEGSEVKAGDIIGKTLDSDIAIILIDRDKAVIENVEEYIKIPIKTKESRTECEWELFYWLPFESGAADVTDSYRAGRYTGPACVSSCSTGEVAIGIVQWTSLTSGGMCNQRDQFLPFMKENYPQFYAKLSFLEGKGADYYWSDYNGANAVQAALLECDRMDHEGFLQAQMECAKANYLEPLLEAHPWLETRPLCVQGEILHLSLWGASLSDLDSHRSDSDKDILAYVRHKIANTSSTAGAATGDESSGRAFSEPEIGYGILDGKLSEAEIEEWVRTADTSVLTQNGINYNGP